jgi:hypothetical protein
MCKSHFINFPNYNIFIVLVNVPYPCPVFRNCCACPECYLCPSLECIINILLEMCIQFGLHALEGKGGILVGIYHHFHIHWSFLSFDIVFFDCISCTICYFEDNVFERSCNQFYFSCVRRSTPFSVCC